MERAFRVVFVRLGIAEVDKRTVASIPFHAPAELRHAAVDRAAICQQHVPVVFRIQLVRERGRADEVAEHEGDLTALDGCVGHHPGHIARTALRAELCLPRARCMTAGAARASGTSQLRCAIAPDGCDCACTPGASQEHSPLAATPPRAMKQTRSQYAGTVRSLHTETSFCRQ